MRLRRTVSTGSCDQRRLRRCVASGLAFAILSAADGSSIAGPSYEYIISDRAGSVRYELAYPTATLDKSQSLTGHHSEKPPVRRISRPIRRHQRST